VVSGFHLEVDENCGILGHDAASSGNFLPTFRDKLLVLSSRVKSKNIEDGTDKLSRNVGKDYHYSLHSIPEECSFQEYLLL
jgi:hypothetical protein